MKITNADIVCGLAWGDEAKGKIVACLIEKNNYDWICRWSGGSNAGHTIYVNKTKFVTHIVPAGILYGIKSYIGPECYINIESLIQELTYLKKNGFDTTKLFISPYAHIITSNHKEEDILKYVKTQGSTGSGIAPCARDKFARKGIQFKDIDVCDYFNKFNKNIVFNSNIYGNILCEGAQGMWLDINYGNYPYVTSSLTLPYSACSLGFPPQKIRDIYGAVKIYDTRVGYDPIFSETLLSDPILSLIAKEGNEFGSTTGRNRKVNWLNVDKLIKSINLSGCNNLIISKLDILDKIKIYKLYYKNELVNFNELPHLITFLENLLVKECKLLSKIYYSDNPYNINNFM